MTCVVQKIAADWAHQKDQNMIKYSKNNRSGSSNQSCKSFVLLLVLLISSFRGDHPSLLTTFCWEVDFIFADLLVVKALSFPTRTIQPTRKPKVIASVLDTRGEGSAGNGRFQVS